MKSLHEDEKFNWILINTPQNHGLVEEMQWPALSVAWILTDDGTRFVSRDMGQTWYRPHFFQWQWIRFYLFLHVGLPVLVLKAEIFYLIRVDKRLKRVDKNKLILGMLIAIILISIYIAEIAETWQESLIGFGLIMVAVIFGVFALLLPSNAKMQENGGEDDERS